MMTAAPRRRVKVERPAISYRLELRIGGTTYGVEPLPEARWSGAGPFA